MVLWELITLLLGCTGQLGLTIYQKMINGSTQEIRQIVFVISVLNFLLILMFFIRYLMNG